MKRALYDWSSMFFVTLAVACGSYWCMSLISNKASFNITLTDKTFIFGDGGVILTKGFNTPQQIEAYDQGLREMAGRPVDSHFALPGLRYRRLSWEGGWDDWMLRVSMALPTLVSAILATTLARLSRHLPAKRRSFCSLLADCTGRESTVAVKSSSSRE